VRVGRCMYIWLRLESGEIGEGGENIERWLIGVPEFHGEYEGDLGFLGCLI
jgi:hypothetical protein